MKNIWSNPLLLLGFRLVVGIVFIYASIDKISDPLGFSDNIDNYHATPVYLNNLIALIVPWMELIVGLCLIFGKFIQGASLLSAVLMIVFIVLIGQALFRGIDLHCGCFKTATDVSVTSLRSEMIRRILEDIVLLGMSLIITMNALKKEEIPLK
ncbi:MAG: DoxX family membrane protein [Candidatus Marinimicrobia bacterium]|nr:DoxX family membrane protein [Candidatus Neomarinimicrobiota bacterium]